MSAIPSARRKTDAASPAAPDGTRCREIPPAATATAAAPTSCIGALVVAADDSVAGALRGALATVDGIAVTVTHAPSLVDALARLQRASFDLVLMDLALPDRGGIAAFDAIQAVAPAALLLVMSDDIDTDRDARMALRHGAHDYLCRRRVDSYWLPRILRHAKDRKADAQVLRTSEARAHAADEALFAERERSRALLNGLGDAVICTDAGGNVTHLSIVAEALTGWPLADALGQPSTDVFRVIGQRPYAESAARGVPCAQVIGHGVKGVLIRGDGSELAIENSQTPLYAHDGRVLGTVIVFRGIGASPALLGSVEQLPLRDAVTGLPNRLQLAGRLAWTIALAKRNGRQAALLLLDIDLFKHVNDSLGRAVGDKLLARVAERLTKCIRGTDIVCQQGGDEFVILLAGLEDTYDPAVAAQRVIDAFSAPHLIDGHVLHVTFSIGISVYPDDGDSVEVLIQRADMAMFHAKACGRNNYQYFRTEMNAQAMRRQVVEGSLHRALSDAEFVLHYQPQIDLASGNLCGAEALIRWSDPELGLVQPCDFIAIAEECGQIVPIGQWVLREACQQISAWLNAGLPVVPIAINVSALEFCRRDFFAGVEQILRETGIPPRYLEMEITESVLMRHGDNSAAVLSALNALGVRLSIDDFGTGYSSLSYLKRFPISSLKIDQSFVNDIAAQSDNASIVRAIINLGLNLRRRVIAEGVETQAQVAFLRANQCEVGQGFRFSRPLPAAQFARLLAMPDDARPWFSADFQALAATFR